MTGGINQTEYMSAPDPVVNTAIKTLASRGPSIHIPGIRPISRPAIGSNVRPHRTKILLQP